MEAVSRFLRDQGGLLTKKFLFAIISTHSSSPFSIEISFRKSSRLRGLPQSALSRVLQISISTAFLTIKSTKEGQVFQRTVAY